MLDSQMEEFVSDQLRWDPKIDHSAIAVSADAGVVTLRGTVGSFRQKRDAEKDAKRVYGVKSVKSDLEVRLLN
jgi:osmotically-inducible protein OsmY